MYFLVAGAASRESESWFGFVRMMSGATVDTACMTDAASTSLGLSTHPFSNGKLLSVQVDSEEVWGLARVKEAARSTVAFGFNGALLLIDGPGIVKAARERNDDGTLIAVGFAGRTWTGHLRPVAVAAVVVSAMALGLGSIIGAIAALPVTVAFSALQSAVHPVATRLLRRTPHAVVDTDDAGPRHRADEPSAAADADVEGPAPVVAAAQPRLASPGARERSARLIAASQRGSVAAPDGSRTVG